MKINILKSITWLVGAAILVSGIGMKLWRMRSADLAAKVQLASQAKVIKALKLSRAAVEKQFGEQVAAQAKEVERLHQINAQGKAAIVQIKVMAAKEIEILRSSLDPWPGKFDTLSVAYQQLAEKSVQQEKLLLGKDLEISAMQGYSSSLLAENLAKDKLLDDATKKLQDTVQKALSLGNHRWVLAVGATTVVASDGKTYWGIGGTFGVRIF
jgi:hypothetical protein